MLPLSDSSTRLVLKTVFRAPDRSGVLFSVGSQTCPRKPHRSSRSFCSPIQERLPLPTGHPAGSDHASVAFQSTRKKRLARATFDPLTEELIWEKLTAAESRHVLLKDASFDADRECIAAPTDRGTAVWGCINKDVAKIGPDANVKVISLSIEGDEQSVPARFDPDHRLFR